MTKHDCYIEALRLDPNNATEWSDLGVDLAPGEHITRV